MQHTTATTTSPDCRTHHACASARAGRCGRLGRVFWHAGRDHRRLLQESKHYAPPLHQVCSDSGVDVRCCCYFNVMPLRRSGATAAAAAAAADRVPRQNPPSTGGAAFSVPPPPYLLRQGSFGYSSRVSSSSMAPSGCAADTSRGHPSVTCPSCRPCCHRPPPLRPPSSPLLTVLAPPPLHCAERVGHVALESHWGLRHSLRARDRLATANGGRRAHAALRLGCRSARVSRRALLLIHRAPAQLLWEVRRRRVGFIRTGSRDGRYPFTQQSSCAGEKICVSTNHRMVVVTAERM